MKVFSTKMIESVFLNFFKSYGFESRSGSPLIDSSIPMSFVMSAGWVQIEQSAKELSARAKDNQEKNIVFVQNCFRHFDMQRVSSQSPVHLSLFRMAGAFHFGVIDPALHIPMIWNLLLQHYTLPPEKIWVTYFAGGEVRGRLFEPDTQTHRAWLQTGIARNHIRPLTGKNFWVQSHGASGEQAPSKCGRTTEVFMDRGERLSCGPDCHPGDGCERFIEVMNILFVQWQISGNTLQGLPLPFTEMVLGVERMAMVKQDTESIHHIDVIQPLLELGDFSNPSKMDIQEQQRHLCLISDHIRALVFLAADGAPPPGKGGRAFIVRKLMREIFTACKLLGIDDIFFLQQMLSRAVEIYSPIHPPVQKVGQGLLASLQAEAAHFEATLARAQRKFERVFTPQFSVEDMITFETSFGAPQPLLEQWLDEKRALGRQQ